MFNSNADAIVEGGTLSSVTGLEDGAIVSVAANMNLTTAENGWFTFVNGDYEITDTVDGSVDFRTDKNSRLTGIANFAGSVDGAFDDLSLNGTSFAALAENITVVNDGTDITGIYGLSDGDSILGSLSLATIALPEGSVTINSATYALAGDSDGVLLTDDGKILTGSDIPDDEEKDEKEEKNKKEDKK